MGLFGVTLADAAQVVTTTFNIDGRVETVNFRVFIMIPLIAGLITDGGINCGLVVRYFQCQQGMDLLGFLFAFGHAGDNI